MVWKFNLILLKYIVLIFLIKKYTIFALKNKHRKFLRIIRGNV